MAEKFREAKKISGIYEIRVNDYVYVGSAGCIGTRWRKHMYSLASGKHGNVVLQRLFDKYGAETFAFQIVEGVENPFDVEENGKTRLINREQLYLDKLFSEQPDKALNILRYADSSFGRVPSQETREKIRKANTGRVFTDETRARLSEARKGRKLSPESIEKTRQSNLGRVYSKEIRERMSQAARNRPKPSAETKDKMSNSHRKYLYTLRHTDGRTVTGNSRSEVATNAGICGASVGQLQVGLKESCKGWTFVSKEPISKSEE